MSSSLSESVASATPARLPLAPRALLFFLAHQDTYRWPLFSGQEIFCGPDTDTRITDGRVLAVKTPPGVFDVGIILRQLPADQHPEILIVKADATERNFPRNLAAVNCPKVLLVGDTHHLAEPLGKVIDYARSEPFDFIVFDHTRHHARFFADAGLKALHWLPAVDYGYVNREVAARPSRPLTFVGQCGKHHPYRRHVLDRLAAAGLPLEILTGSLAQTADNYADSQITLNISLNGDLNLRVFEALAAGGFLITDELPAGSGFSLLFKRGEHLETWRDPGELIEKIRYYHAHPAEARRIRLAGQAEIVRAHHPEVKLREFYDLVFNGRENPRYRLETSQRVSSLGQGGAIAELVPAYEFIQELHRGAEQVTLFCEPESTAFVREFADLRRCAVRPVSELAADTFDPLIAQEERELPRHHVLWWSDKVEGLRAVLGVFFGQYVIAPQACAAELNEWGYTPAGTGYYQLTNPLVWLQGNSEAGAKRPSAARLKHFLDRVDRAEDALVIAELAGKLELASVYQDALHRAISLDRNCLPALLQLASLCLDAGQPTSAAIVLSESARLGPLPAEIESLRQDLLSAHAASDELKVYQRMMHATTERTAQPRRILLVTNLFPPEELGGYGRMMWEFAHGLRERGHEITVLCGDADYLRKTPTGEESTFEAHVARRLQLLGEWREGAPRLKGSPAQLAKMAAANAGFVVQTARETGTEIVLLGNLDFLGADLLHATLSTGVPVLHTLANAAPGYEVAACPNSPLYWVAPCSNWNGRAFLQAKYQAARVETVYPGARIDRFYHFFLPDLRKLRIAYASLVMPYKGAHVLIQALARLHRAGLDFTADIAGEGTDPAFLTMLRNYIAEVGMTEKVRFTGFLDRNGLSALFARTNVLVFPSQFAEPFGISQVEALASGLVVVSSGTGGAAEIIRHGHDGLLFPATDPKALAERLAALASQPELFRTLQSNGQKRALNFSVDRAVAKIEQLMNAMLQRLSTSSENTAISPGLLAAAANEPRT